MAIFRNITSYPISVLLDVRALPFSFPIALSFVSWPEPLLPVLTSLFLRICCRCICHSCDWTTLTLENRTSYEHYSRWHRGADTTTPSVHIDDRMPNGAGALDSDPMCMPYP